MNAQLSNGYWVQNVYSTEDYEENGVWKPSFTTAVFAPGTCTTQDNGVLCNSSLVGIYYYPYYGATCAWLVIAIWNGTAYFGYSLDGVNVDWYYEYPVGNAVIIPDQATSIVLAGPGNGEGLNITNADVVLAWYYWNGSAWVPAPSTGLLKVMTLTNNLKPGDETTEYVSNAWVYWSNGTAVVSWPQPINQTPSVPAPGFSP